MNATALLRTAWVYGENTPPSLTAFLVMSDPEPGAEWVNALGGLPVLFASGAAWMFPAA